MYKNTMRSLLTCLMIVLVFALLGTTHAAAQETNSNELLLRITDRVGTGLGNKIQGAFTLKVSGPENLNRVVYYIDDQVMYEATTAPFNFRFSTDKYPGGARILSAVGYTADGREIRSNTLSLIFLTPEQDQQAMGKILIPVLAIVGIAMAASFVPALMGRKAQTPLGAERKYGFAGGAICPKCKRPFSLNAFGLNLITGKLERCPYCGHWGIMRATSIAKLREAEQAELATADSNGTVPTASEEDKLRKEIDDSRYQDL